MHLRPGHFRHGQPDLSAVHPGGSFWINDSFPLLDLPPGEDPRHNPRNRCIHGGYASVALVPIRNPDRIVGLLQFNDRRKGCFSLGTVELLEGIAAHIGAALTQRQADDGLRRSERKYRTLFESLAEGVALHEIVKDEAGKAVDYRILDVNPAYQRHTGIDAASAPGRLGSEIYGTLPPPFLVEYDRVANGGEDLAFETWFAPLARHFRISVVSHRQGQFATLFDDITRRRGREEELRQKTAEMERFTRMISHDLKAPLVTVGTFLGFVERDLEEGSLERLGKDLGFIRGATVKMARRLEDLLAISEVGRVVNAPEEVDLADLIRESVKTVAGAIAIAGVEVRIDASPVTLFGDRSQLEQVWQNLVENAVKYMGDQPSPRIDLGVVAQGDQTVFFVRDNGIGIDPRFHGRVFEPFEKLDAASEGTGLGLALVRRIVEIHQGRVWLESEGQGRGSRFLFTLPRALKGGESRG